MNRLTFVTFDILIAVLCCSCETQTTDTSFDAGDTDSETDSNQITDAGEKDASDVDSGETDTETDSGDTDTDAIADGGFENIGICGVFGSSVVSAGSFSGTEEIYLIGDEGHGDDICRVRYELTYLGEPSVPCGLCEWAMDVEKRNPIVVTDIDGGCSASELQLDQAAIADLDGERVSLGYVAEYMGHENVLMQYYESNQSWDPITTASWDATTGELIYDKRDGFCGY